MLFVRMQKDYLPDQFYGGIREGGRGYRKAILYSWQEQQLGEIISEGRGELLLPAPSGCRLRTCVREGEVKAGGELGAEPSR